MLNVEGNPVDLRACDRTRISYMAKRDTKNMAVDKKILSGLKVFATDVDGTLTDGGMYYSAEGELLKCFNTRDAFGMNILRNMGLTLSIVTSEDSPIVLARAVKLNIEHVYVGVQDKIRHFEKFIEGVNCTWDELAYIGDDLNDLEAIRRAGFSACPADACEQVRDAAKYICQNSGGHGAVREACDLIAGHINSQKEKANDE